jgi:hypothetical protein
MVMVKCMGRKFIVVKVKDAAFKKRKWKKLSLILIKKSSGFNFKNKMICKSLMKFKEIFIKIKRADTTTTIIINLTVIHIKNINIKIIGLNFMHIIIHIRMATMEKMNKFMYKLRMRMSLISR